MSYRLAILNVVTLVAILCACLVESVYTLIPYLAYIFPGVSRVEVLPKAALASCLDDVFELVKTAPITATSASREAITSALWLPGPYQPENFAEVAHSLGPKSLVWIVIVGNMEWS